jgi:flagellar protein FliS
MTNPAHEYRKRAVESASPVGLVVLLYGGAVTNLMRAIAAIEAGNVEKRVLELNKALDIIAQLQGTLDFEQGGAVAAQLDKFYHVMRSQILEASIKNSKPLLEDLVKHMSSLKEAWQQVERETTMRGVSGMSAVAPAPPSLLNQSGQFATARL